MKNPRHKVLHQKFGIATAALLAATMVVSGCSSASETETSACDPFPGVIFVVSVHANSAAPNLTPALACQLGATIAAELPVGVIALDGTPSIVMPAMVIDVAANNPNKRRNKIDQAVGAVVGAIQNAVADSDGSDLMRALTLAVDSAATSDPKIGQLVVLDSGLPDTGALKMSDPGMTSAIPEQVANFLLNSGAIATDTFEDLAIQLVGFGYVAGAQEALAASQEVRVREIFEAVLTAGGANVEVVPYPRTGPAPETEFVTKTVEVEDTGVFKPAAGQQFVMGDAGPLRFEADEAYFVDLDAARLALTDLAMWLAPGSGHHLTVTGTTASGDYTVNIGLSQRRADAVKSLLVEIGADATLITTAGIGYTANPPDHDEHGNYNPGAAALNRTVILSIDR